jgi:hypothetical protein
VTNVKKTGRARLQLRLGAPFLDLDLAVQADRTGYSEGHIRQILRGQQIGEPFIAAVLCAWPTVPFERQFEAVPGVRQPSAPGTPASATAEPEPLPVAGPPKDFPLTYSAALEYGLVPEQGPPLFEGADDHEPDRIVVRVGEVPVLAFQADPHAIRTYAATRDHEQSMQLLAYYGVTEWTGNLIRISG